MDGGDEEIDSIGIIEHEVTLLLRLVESARKRAEVLDRSAYLLLGALETHGPLGIAALAEIFQMDLSTASRQTAALETKGLVQRLADPRDARVSLLQSTALGRTLFQSVRDTRHALFAEMLGSWPDDERQQFGAHLARLNQAIVQRRRTQRLRGQD